MDLAASLALLGVLVVLAASYGVRLVRQGRARAARVEREGKSALLGKGVMEAMYWTIAPVGGALARRGVSANAVTWASLVLALAAGGALGAGHFGVGAVLALIAAAGDALDGFVARATGTSSDAGEVLDAAVDRYSELAFLAGVGVAFRGDVALLTLTMGAIAASFMVSYSTAKAEALRVLPPRGSMRRTERAVLLVTGAALTPIAAALFPSPWDRAPMVAALAVVAVFGNVSAARRLASLVRSIRAREATPPGERATPATAFASVTALPKKPVHGAAPASQVSPASHASQPPQASQVSPLRRPRPPERSAPSARSSVR